MENDEMNNTLAETFWTLHVLYSARNALL